MAPIQVKEIDKKFRLVDADGKIARNARTGTVLDGGGHADKSKAERQAGYVNGTQPSRRP